MLLWCAKGIEPPIRGRKIRFAVGHPNGMSSNAWVVSTTGGGDIYITGRDSFRESKVSLHKSGKWRLATTEHAARQRPDLVPEGTDRAAVKWDRPDSWGTHPVHAFRLVILPVAIYLEPEKRVEWGKKVAFIEPPTDLKDMTVVDVWVVSEGTSVGYPDVPSIRIAVLGLDDTMSVHVMAAHELGTYDGLEELGKSILHDSGDMSHDELANAVALTFGYHVDGARLLMPIPMRIWL